MYMHKVLAHLDVVQAMAHRKDRHEGRGRAPLAASSASNSRRVCRVRMYRPTAARRLFIALIKRIQSFLMKLVDHMNV
jgi:hypothetical protein